MKKTLTEQWRNGTLEQKYYYVKYFGNGQKPFVEIELKNFLLDLVKVKDSDKIEFLAAVPTYDEFIQQRDFVKDHLKVLIENMNLKRKLDIATKALKKYENNQNWDIRGVSFMKYNKGFKLAKKALKEMEGVK